MIRIVILISGLFFTHAGCAAEFFGTVEAVSGGVNVIDTNGDKKSAYSGQQIFAGQSVQTANDGEVHIASGDSGLIALRPGSFFRIDSYRAKGASTDESVFTLFKGAVRSITGWIAKRNNAAYRLHTPTVTIGVRGTDHETTVLESASNDAMPGTYDTVNEGVTVLKTAFGEIEVRPGQHAFASRDEKVVPRLLVQHPEFFTRRQLRIEERIQQRKDILQQNVQNTIKENAGEIRENIGERKPDAKKNREAIKKKMQERKRPERRIP